MSKTTKVVTDVELKAVPLPVKTETYTVISHGFIIDEVESALTKAGFAIVDTEYRASNNLEVARGSYLIKRTEDPNFLMSFSWVNSYDKSTKFQCCVGGYVLENNSYVIDKDEAYFIRKHTGDADSIAKATIQEKIADADKYYKAVLSDKNLMASLTITRSEIATMLGDLYFTYDMLSIEQLSGVKKEYLKPSYIYSTPADSLWTIYCHILTVIKSSHPKGWMYQQGFIHNYIKLNYMMFPDVEETQTFVDLLKEEMIKPMSEVDPAQTNLLDQIAEIEAAATYLTENAEELIAELLLTEEEAAPTEEEIIAADEAWSIAPQDEVIFYEDPAGNTFEVPVVEETLDDVPGDVKSYLREELTNIFGYEVDFEVTQEEDYYNIITNDGQEVTVPVEYINKLRG